MPASTIVKTEAITLRVAPFSNTSHMVTWLTPEHGKIATAIKGACRPKSPVFGQYDIGYLCELLFYARERNGIHIVKECSTLDARDHCRGDWQRTSAISYLCHLASVATPDGAHAPELYSLLAACLNHLTPATTKHLPFLKTSAFRTPTVDRLSSADRSQGAALESPTSLHLPALLLWFELQLLALLGLPPQLLHCTSCTQAVDTEGVTLFSTTHGGILCKACKPTVNRAVLLPLSGDALAILRRWQATHDFPRLPTPRYTQQKQEQIQAIMASFMSHYLDLAPECCRIAYKMINTTL
jgi:recombinational DNA repair protein (RecF pathway)